MIAREVPLGYAAAEVRSRNSGGQEQNLLSLSYGRIVDKDITSNEGLLPASFETYNIVKPGDTVLRLTDLQNDQRSLRVGLVTHPGIITSAYVTIRAGRELDGRFLNYFLKHMDFQKKFYALGAGVRQSLKFDELRRVSVPVPELTEQRAIADYLDAETARMDALIAKKQQLIHLLEERWRGFVDTATSDGDAVRVRHVTSLRTSGPRGWADRVGERGQPFIRSGNLTRDSIDLDHRDLARVVAPEAAEAQRSSTRAGDSLVGITGANTGWVAAVDSSTEAGFVSQHVAILRPAGVEPRWLTYSLFAPRSQDQLLGGQYGGTKTQLGLQDLAELKISLPPRDVQQALLEKLDAERLRRGRLIESVSKQVELLSERRQAMITALVTGALPATGGLS